MSVEQVQEVSELPSTSAREKHRSKTVPSGVIRWWQHDCPLDGSLLSPSSPNWSRWLDSEGVSQSLHRSQAAPRALIPSRSDFASVLPHEGSKGPRDAVGEIDPAC